MKFPDIDWNHLSSIYGWPGLQYQAWARGRLTLNKESNQTIAIFTDGLLEISINGQRYFGGDVYSYHKVPILLSLPPGDNVVELRLIRDVRAMGGIGEPLIEVALDAEIRHESLTVDERSLIVPEMIDGTLGSSWASVNVQNNAPGPIEILSIESSNVGTFRKLLIRSNHGNRSIGRSTSDNHGRDITSIFIPNQASQFPDSCC